MKISLTWLAQYVTVPADRNALEDALTRAGLTVEAVAEIGASIDKVVVAQILESEPHPNADRLSVCRVDDGSGSPRQIVCGAKNYKVGDKVPLALPGAVLPGDFKIKVGKLRGVESEGMLCSAKELRLAEDAEGLLILSSEAEVGVPIAELFPAETVLDLEVTPNRPDCLGHLGVARELAAFTGVELRPPQTTAVREAEDASLRIESGAGCIFYSARRIRGVTVGPSPAWLKTRLEAVGLRSINNIVDITNYVMLELGQPLHAFDAAHVEGDLFVRSSQEGEEFFALDGRTYALPAGAPVVACEAKALALGGIMGGETSGVTESTTDLVLESALFEAPRIRRVSRGLSLHTDSSYRFERGVDPQGVLLASARATELILQLAGGTADESVCSAGSLPPLPHPVALRLAKCRSVLGCDISTEDIEHALEPLGLRQAEPGLWQIPTWRLDLSREVDLIEEVARLYGIDKIPGRVLGSPAPASPADEAYDFLMRLRGSLAALGFFEARTGALVPADLCKGAPTIALRNPLGEEQAVLRAQLVPLLLEASKNNFNHGELTVRLFEIGKTFHAEDPEERLHLGLLLSGPTRPADWRDASPHPTDFFDLKAALSKVLPGPIEFRRVEPDEHLALRAEILHSAQVVGHAGQLPPAAARKIDAPAPVFVAEIHLASWLGHTLPDNLYRPIPEFPTTSRDVAIVAPLALPYESLAREIAAAQEPLLSDFRPINIYHDPEGKHLPSHSKSLAISLTFRAPDRTLKTEEANEATARIKQRLRDKLAVAFRE